MELNKELEKKQNTLLITEQQLPRINILTYNEYTNFIPFLPSLLQLILDQIAGNVRNVRNNEKL